MIFDIMFTKAKYLKKEDINNFKNIILLFLERIRNKIPDKEYINNFFNEISSMKIENIKDIESLYSKLQQLSVASAKDKNKRVNGRDIIPASPEVYCREEIDSFIETIGGKNV